jgi:hypothetical protein
MTHARDIERVLEHWLDDGIDQMPDRVYLAILDRVEHQPQQRAWRVSWRNSTMNSYLKPILAVAAVVVIAVAGIAIVGRPSGSDVGGPGSPAPSPSPIESASPSTSPSASAAFPTWFTAQGDGAGILPAGSQTTRRFVPGSTFTVPDGWVNDADNGEIYALFPDTPANEAAYARSKQTAQNMVLVRTIANNMFAFCDATGLFQGATAAEVMDFLMASEALSTTEPVDVKIDGLSGRQIDLQLDSDWTGSCPPDADDPTRDYLDERNRVIVLDTADGRTIGIGIGSRSSSDYQAFLAEAMPIIESFRFDTAQ